VAERAVALGFVPDGQAQAVAAFHVLKTYLRPDARLLLVGALTTPDGAGLIEAYARELALRDVVLTDRLEDAELAAVFRRADLLLQLGDEAGSAIPLIQALAFGLPIVAAGSPAVAELAGGAALLLDDPGPALVAEAVDRLLGEESWRAKLAAGARKRAAALDAARTSRLLAAEVRRA